MSSRTCANPSGRTLTLLGSLQNASKEDKREDLESKTGNFSKMLKLTIDTNTD